jgi:hypothetical protein
MKNGLRDFDMSLTNAVPAESNYLCKRQLGLNQGEIEASQEMVNGKSGTVARLPHLRQLTKRRW